MRKAKTEINVRVVFHGKQDRTQAFANLIIKKCADKQEQSLETIAPARYNSHKVFSCVRVAEKEEIA
jgi:hypothetical protein